MNSCSLIHAMGFESLFGKKSTKKENTEPVSSDRNMLDILRDNRELQNQAVADLKGQLRENGASGREQLQKSLNEAEQLLMATDAQIEQLKKKAA